MIMFYADSYLLCFFRTRFNANGEETILIKQENRWKTGDTKYTWNQYLVYRNPVFHLQSPFCAYVYFVGTFHVYKKIEKRYYVLR